MGRGGDGEGGDGEGGGLGRGADGERGEGGAGVGRGGVGRVAPLAERPPRPPPPPPPRRPPRPPSRTASTPRRRHSPSADTRGIGRRAGGRQGWGGTSSSCPSPCKGTSSDSLVPSGPGGDTLKRRLHSAAMGLNGVQLERAKRRLGRGRAELRQRPPAEFGPTWQSSHGAAADAQDRGQSLVLQAKIGGKVWCSEQRSGAKFGG